MGAADMSGFEFLNVDQALDQIGDLAALHDMLDMLQNTLTRDIPLIEQYLQQHDVAKANRVLHAIKGFIPIFCTELLCTEVAAIELLSKTGTADEVLPFYALLRPKLERLQAEIDAYML
jgi:hypothetical protein